MKKDAKIREEKKVNEQNCSAKLNGIPENQKCTWDYETLCRFYHKKLVPEIALINSALNGVRHLLSDKGEDGSNGTDELFSNSKTTDNEYSRSKMVEDESKCLAKLQFLQETKDGIEKGEFICKCDYEIFYAKKIL